MTRPTTATGVIAATLCVAACGALSHPGGKDDGAFHATEVSDALAHDAAAAEPVCGSELAWPTEPSLGLAIDSTVVLMEATGLTGPVWEAPRWFGCVHVCVKQPSAQSVEIHYAAPDPSNPGLWITRPDAASTVAECSKACSAFCVNAGPSWHYRTDGVQSVMIISFSRGADEKYESTRLELPIALKE